MIFLRVGRIVQQELRYRVVQGNGNASLACPDLIPVEVCISTVTAMAAGAADL